MNKFKRLRKKLGLSQEACARKLNISTASVVNYEREAPDYIISKMQKFVEAK